eukprot:m.37037 g.37037  ORF g.37037 m.37037 type:complete len:228 (+) comp9757_c0_seq1:1423-2106(+)
MATEAGYVFKPVECFGSVKVRWGTGQRVMEGKCMLGASTVTSGSACGRVGGVLKAPRDRIVTSDLVLNAITIDFACNYVLFDPVSEVYIDVTGHGLHDILHRQLRVPVAADMWELWYTQNPRKIYRYWKMRLIGFTPVSQEMSDFVLTKTVEMLGGADESSLNKAKDLLSVLSKTKRHVARFLAPLKSMLTLELTSAIARGIVAPDATPDSIWAVIAHAYSAWTDEP